MLTTYSEKKERKVNKFYTFTILILAFIVLFNMLNIDVQTIKYILIELDTMSILQRICLIFQNVSLQYSQTIENMKAFELIAFISIELIVIKVLIDLYIPYFKNIKIDNIKNEWLRETIRKTVKPYIKIWRFCIGLKKRL